MPRVTVMPSPSAATLFVLRIDKTVIKSRAYSFEIIVNKSGYYNASALCASHNKVMRDMVTTLSFIKFVITAQNECPGGVTALYDAGPTEHDSTVYMACEVVILEVARRISTRVFMELHACMKRVTEAKLTDVSNKLSSVEAERDLLLKRVDALKIVAEGYKRDALLYADHVPVQRVDASMNIESVVAEIHAKIHVTEQRKRSLLSDLDTAVEAFVKRAKTDVV